MSPIDREAGISLREGVKVDTFLFTHPIRTIIEEHDFQFMCTEVQGYLPTLVREFYTNLRENQWVDTLLETTVMGKKLKITLDFIAHCLQYVHPAASDRPYPLRPFTDFDAHLFVEAM